jgi:serine/threonine-protein kinase
MASSTGSNDHSQPSSKPPEEAAAGAAPAQKKLGKYEIQKKIGAGGMGAVYLALDPLLKRSCALKVLPHEKAKNPTLLKRFKAEAAAAAALRHENIVTVFEAGEADGYSYIALEYVEGTDVARLVDQRGAIPLKRSIEIVRQVTKALEHAHEQGIVHRDIKPGNILLRRDGVVKLADLGLARVLDENTDTSITRAGTTVGTVDYMSPEQARDSKAADVRSDIYSLGCTWYFMLTGEPPFNVGSLTNKLRAHAENQLPDPRSENPKVTEAVFGVMRRMTEKKPGKRYQTPAELLTDLDATSLTSDIVSDTILSEIADEEDEVSAKPRKEAEAKAGRGDDSDAGPKLPPERKSRPPVKADADAPAFKPPPGRDKPVPDEKKKKLRSNAPLFYGLAALLLVAIVAGIISFVKDIGASSDAADRMANPFANRNAVGKSGKSADATTNITGTSSAVKGQASDQTQRTTYGTGNPDDETNPAATGQNPPGVGSGPTTTRISTDEKGEIKTETFGGPPAGATGGAESGSTASGGAPGGATSGTASTGVGSGGSIAGPGGSGSPSRAGSAQSAARKKQESAFVGEPARRPDAGADLPKLLVQPGASGHGQLPSLNDAFERVPEGGAVIQLAGAGPFPLYPVKVSDKTIVIIEPRNPADLRNAPLIVLLPGDQKATSSFAEFVNTALELRNVHLGLDALALGARADDALISAVSSDVFVQNCSLSVKGNTKTPLAAIRVSGKASRGDRKTVSPLRVVLENTLIRGSNLTGLSIDGEYVDLSMRNSLVWSGGAAALRFGPVARSGPDSGRNVRLASTTLCSQKCAVQLSGDASQPVAATFSLLNSLVAAPTGGASPALLALEGWNQNQQKAAFGKSINWKSTDTLYTGWVNLIQINPGEIALATTPAQWQQSWKDKAPPDKNQFQTANWPSQSIVDVAGVNADALAPQSIGKQYVKTSDGGWPGCTTDALVIHNLESLDAAQMAAVRPEIPRGMFDFIPRDTIRIELTARDSDLGKILERKQLSTGTHVIVSGSGTRQSSPIVVENAWVRLTFEQAEGPPLVLTPKVVETKHDAFISVENGGIAIEGGVFTVPAAERQTLPKWFIRVVDGDLGLWRCRVQGPMAGTTRNKGLIQWQRKSGRPPARMFDGGFDGYAALQDCFLIGSGTLFEADMHHRALIFRNNVAVSRDDLFELSIRGPDSQIAGVVDLHRSTLSAVDRFIHVEGAELGSPTTAPLAIVADRCVFAPPLRAGQQKVAPTLLSYTGAVLEQKQISWWENRCGYAADITSFLRADSAPASGTPQNFEQAWVGQWGAGQIIEPLTGVGGVVLKADLPTKTEDRSKIEPSDFQLHASARASTWDGFQKPIGVSLATMKLPPLRAESAPAPKKKPAKDTVPSTPTPGF